MEYSESIVDTSRDVHYEMNKVDQFIIKLSQKERKMLKDIALDSKLFLDAYPIKHVSKKYKFIQELLGVL
jgi:hypothetical protein